MDLIAQLEAQNENYWRIRNRVKENQNKLKSSDRIKKNKCRYATRMMIKNGSIIHTVCEKCGDKNSQIHHLNYDDPEAVMFLCEKHHRQWHKENNIH